MALEVCPAQQTIFKDGNQVHTYGWFLTDGVTEVARIGFKSFESKWIFSDIIKREIEKFIPTEDLNMEAIIALLFRYDGSEFNDVYLESLLFSHVGMDVNKSDTIIELAYRLSGKIK